MLAQVETTERNTLAHLKMDLIKKRILSWGVVEKNLQVKNKKRVKNLVLKNNHKIYLEFGIDQYKI